MVTGARRNHRRLAAVGSRGFPGCLAGVALTLVFSASTVEVQAQHASAERLVLDADRVFDGLDLHEGWRAVVEGDRIVAAGPLTDLPIAQGDASIRHSRLPGATLLPGLIEGHSHLLLHPYDETNWNDQVLRSNAERVARPQCTPARPCWPAGAVKLGSLLADSGDGYALTELPRPPLSA